MIFTSPFPDELLPLVWQWLNEFPRANFDDYGPKDESEFVKAMRERMTAERTWLVSENGPCGIMAYLPLTERMGFTHGICFAQGKITRENKLRAVRAILDELFASGVEKVCASYFADNAKIGSFLRDLGAAEEGLLRHHTLRGGEVTDMRQVAIFRGGGN